MLNIESFDKLVQKVTDVYNINKSQLFGKSRAANVVEARQVFCYFLRKDFKLSFPVIGKILNKDHTTVMYACKKVEKEITKNKNLRKKVDNCRTWQLTSLSKKEFKKPKKPKIKKNKKELNLSDKVSYVEFFLPDKKNKTEQLSFPLFFGDDYLNNLLKNLNEREREIIIDRYGFFEGEFSSLEEVASKLNITRERVRQIIDSALLEIYKNNFGGANQVVERIAKEVIEKDIVLMEDIINDIYYFQEDKKSEAVKFILILTSSVKWIRKFEFSERIFLINEQGENYILDNIDKIKKMIKLILNNKPGSVNDRWAYVYVNLLDFTFFKNKPNFKNKNFLKACYDNLLFESKILLKSRNDFKKYKINKNIEGISDGYKIFFK